MAKANLMKQLLVKLLANCSCLLINFSSKFARNVLYDLLQLPASLKGTFV